MQKKKILLGAAFFIATILLLYAMDFTTGRIIRKDNFDKVWWMAKIKGQKYDFAFIGASRVYTMVETAKMDSAWQKKGINLALDGSNTMEQYLILKKFLANGNTMRDLFIDLDYAKMDYKFNGNFRIWCFLPYIQQDPYVYEEIRRNFGENKAFCWKYLPYYRYAEFNSKLGFFVLLNAGLKLAEKPYDKNGDIVRRYVQIMDSSKSESDLVKRRQQVDTIHMYYLEKIGRLCLENKIRMHVYTPPFYYLRLLRVANGDEILANYVQPTVNKVHADYHSFCKLPISRIARFYNDPLHLNKQGLPYLTKSIIDYYSDVIHTK
jgi:hypothetical protein